MKPNYKITHWQFSFKPVSIILRNYSLPNRVTYVYIESTSYEIKLPEDVGRWKIKYYFDI